MIEEPEVNLVLDHAIREEDEAVAEVTTSAGEVTAVQWSVENAAVATVQADNDDVTKAVVTGVAEGETTVTADVKVTVEGKEFTVQAEANLRVVKKDALIVKATIESAPTELALAETAGISVSVDTGTIESVTWAIEGTAATIETDGVEAVITAKELGEVTVSVTVTVKSGEKTATDTATAKIEITPITYVIGKDVEVLDANGWNAVFLNDIAKKIKVKKTDIVEAVFSVNGSGDVKLGLSTWEDLDNKTIQNLSEQAVLKADTTANGKAVFTLNDKFFKGNYADINSIAVSCSEQAVVTIEKILITPTDKVAFSLQAPVGVEIGTPGEIKAEVDEGYELEWKTSDATIATVEGSQTGGIVTGKKAGTVTITVVVKAADGTVVDEKSVELNVTEAFKNQAQILDLAGAYKSGTTPGQASETLEMITSGDKTTGFKIKNETHGISIDLPHQLAAGDKVKVVIKGSLETANSGFRMYLTDGSNGGIGGVSTNNNQGLVAGDNTGSFTKEIELEAGTACGSLCIRIPGGSFGGWIDRVDGVTITEIAVTYL